MTAQTQPVASADRHDAVMISSVRQGDMAAWGDLYRNHVAAAYHLARQLARCHADADDLVSEAFVRVLGAIRDGHGPDSAFRAYLLTALRHVAYDKTRRDRRTELTDDVLTVTGVRVGKVSEPFRDTALAALERSLAATAFARLPKRWIAVLWYIEVEDKTPSEVAPLFGLTANGVSALAYRAREGLRQAYLQAHLAKRVAGRCPTIDKLGPWARNGLSKRDTTAVLAHLAECQPCRELAVELVDTTDGLAHEDATRYLAAVASSAAPSCHRPGRTTGSSARSAPRSQRSWPSCVRAISAVPRRATTGRRAL